MKVAGRLADKLIGGGPLAGPKLAGSTDYPIDSSSKADMKKLMTKMTTDKKAGKFGGFFNFTDV